MAAAFDEFVVGNHKLLTLCWSSAVHKIPYQSSLIVYSSSCNSPNVSMHIAPCLTSINLTSYYNIFMKTLRDKW